MRSIIKTLSESSKFCKWLADNKGAVMPLAAFFIPVVVGGGGLGVDFSSWMSQKRNLQTAVDAAALAGAWEMGRENLDLIEFSALNAAVANGYNPDQGGVLEVGYDEELQTVSVNLSQEASLYLSSVIFSDDIVTTVEAEAEVAGYTDGFCILSLNPISSGTLTTSGSVEIDMPDCGIAVNSADDEAFKLNGNVTVNVDNVNIVGSYDVAGGSADFTYNDLKTGAPPITDPYADIETPEPGGCDFNNYRPSGSDITLSPGTYCGGIRITGNNDVYFEPGIYIIDGGTVDISGNGTVTGEEVSFILTGSDNDYANIDITGGKDIYFSAPLEGDDMEGIVFYQDESAPTGGVNKIVGNASMVLDGVAYFPSQEINIGGTSSAGSDACTKIVGDYVIIHGTPYIGNDCSDSAADPIGNPIIKLTS